MKNLDFILFGVARSGTTALAKAANLHPEIFCGIECFKPTFDHSRLVIPGDFLNENIAGAKRAKENEFILGKKGTARVYGNKFPRYYFHLSRLHKEMPPFTAIGIYREGFGFVSSWNRRSTDKSGWKKGRIGVVGILEQIFCLLSLAQSSHDCRLFSYEKLFYLDSNHIDEFYRAINVSCDDELRNCFFSEFFRGSEALKKNKDLKPLEAEMINSLDIFKVDEIINESSGHWFSDIKHRITPLLKGMQHEVKENFSNWFEQCDQSVHEFILAQIPVWSSIDKDLAYSIENKIRSFNK